MPRMLKLIAKNNFQDAIDFLKNHTDMVFIKAVRSAMNKAIRKTGTRASEQIREVYKLKAGEVSPSKGKYLRIRKAKGNSLLLLNAEVKASVQPVSLMRFSRQKEPLPQKGIAVSKRKRLRPVAVGPGKKVYLPRAFIARASGKQGDGQANQIFVRGKTGKLYKKSVPSVWRVLRKDKFYRSLDAYARREFETIFAHEYAYYQQKALKT